MTVTYLEPMTPLRDWLRGTTLTSGARVYVTGSGGLPSAAFVAGDDAADLVGPTIGVFRVGGGVDQPFDRPLVQFDCWAPRAGAATVAATLAAELCTVLGGIELTDLGDNLWLLGADVVSNLPITGSHPRHVVTADVTVQAR